MFFRKKYELNMLLDFYRNQAPNCNGLYLNDIWYFSDLELEKTHDYIQWLFPIMEKSRYNSKAPVLNSVQVMMLCNDELCRENMRKSVEVFLEFLGMNLNTDDSINLNEDFLIKSENWLTKKNHNYKRITRLITFLKLFKFYEIVDSLMCVLDELYKNNEDIIGKTTYKYWENAYKAP